MKISILVGTMTGTAQLCAQEMELALDDGDNRAETLLMDQLDSSVFSRDGVFLICTSTYGQGDVPDNAKAHYDDLRARRPNLSGVRYGVFGLGDRTYAETFNFGGKRSMRSWPSLAQPASASGTSTTPRAACCPRKPRSSGASSGLPSSSKATEPRFNFSNEGAHSQGGRRARPASRRRAGPVHRFRTEHAARPD